MSNVVMNNCNMTRIGYPECIPMKKIALAAVALIALVLSGCSQNQQANLEPALDSIKSDSLLSEIKTLSSDDFEGRKPGSAGEQKTIAYMQQQFQQMGLKPGNPD